MQVTIGNTDITSCVQESTYRIDMKDEYKSYIDAAGNEHRFTYRSKIKGSFDMVFLPNYSLDYSTVLALIENATVDKILTITLTVNNLDGASRTIQAYYSIDFEPMRQVNSTITIKRAKITINER